jgi:hypothetical protein
MAEPFGAPGAAHRDISASAQLLWSPLMPMGPGPRHTPEVTAEGDAAGPARPVRQVRFSTRDEGPVAHLGELAIIVRNQFRLAGSMSDAAILESLRLVMQETDMRARWLALFASPLGEVIRRHGRDLNTSLGFVLAKLPAQES